MDSEFGVSDKETKKNSCSNSSVLGLGVKVPQGLEAFPSKMTTTTVHHNHHHRSLSPFDNDSFTGGDGDGPTAYISMTNHINDVISVISGASAPCASAMHSGGAAAAPVRPLQPFDISTSTSATTTRPAFKSPAGGGMAASLGFPFTIAQRKELERQAMIYKYMMASVPVPADLLIPTSVMAASRSHLDSGFNLRLSSSSTDPEPGRCRRTDGKKWRCSRDVAPNHKYCERHMHRGRPRSRKLVEVHANNSSSSNNNNNNQQIKRARHDYHPFPASAVTVAISNPTIRKDTSSSQFSASATSQAYHEPPLSLDNVGVKATNFESVASVPSDKEPRGLDWMLKGDPVSMAASDPEWQPLLHNKVGLTTHSCGNNNASISSPNYEEPRHLISYGLFNSGLEQPNRCSSLFLNPLVDSMENPQSDKPRGFIDAWSNAETEENNANANKSSVASNGKLSLSSLDLSMGGGDGSVDEEMGTIQMGLGLMEPNGNTENDGIKTNLTNWLTPAPWVASTPGGPLAEVLMPSTVAAATHCASNPSSPVITNAESSSPLATMVSSPSGILQKTLASLSDSSSSSSPTVASSRANSEIALLWFNHSKLASST